MRKYASIFKDIICVGGFSVFTCGYSSNISGKSKEITCMNESGKPVDWWVISKLPVISSELRGTKFHDGYAYAYADADSPELVMSDMAINDTTTALAYTLEPIYGDTSQSGDLLWLLYNDQPPESKVSSSYAHSKGVIAFDDTQGFWLIHSTPRFPLDPSKEPYQFPANERLKGQSFLCVNYRSNQFEQIMKKLWVNRPYIYNAYIPDKTSLPVSLLNQLLAGGFQSSPTAITSVLTSKGGVQLNVFAKNSEWNDDLYEGFVQVTFDQDMIVQSWRLGANSTIMPSYCRPEYKYDSLNIMKLSINGTDGSQYSWKYTVDHSKWAATLDSSESTKYICIGDINRMKSQYHRGGGTACLSVEPLWKSFRDTSLFISECPNTKSK
ncbi:deoxyribonuclease II [Heterostelium album PN500]|uniref:Deoxyribonuclease II n=1 Tax=Heterostelium pallidum (strain ATCC 26659 / Pp 5 / PN500) TaxID=670386 RepID=D3B253_HETP5|nr:deoxyribonuclease II [Heterostelium album PN500]EFA84428.1 deoxyribonuclease II [Heterostelium album PN500]|eukprot:XP_020436542.1 deoxyribonuclease II [Heterostelium album PN500]